MEDYMLPQPTQPGARSGAPTAGGRDTNRQQGLPYVRWNSPFLSFDWKTARIKDVKVNTPKAGRENYSDVIVKVSVEGTLALYGLKADQDEFATLARLFGTDENNWTDKEFLIRLEEDTFDGKRWVRVSEKVDSAPPAPSSRRNRS
jgi:hypothetical protein